MAPNSCEICVRALSSNFFITLREPDLRNIFLSDIFNLRGVSQYIDLQWQVIFLALWEFVIPNTNAIIFKTKNFYDSFVPTLKATSNLNILEKEMMVIATLFRNLQTVKDLVRPLSEKHSFRAPFDSQHVKGSKTLVKSEREHFHHICALLWGNLIWKISPLVIC